MVFEHPELPLKLLENLYQGKASLSLKWDGAPAIFCGNDEKGFFLGRKGVFNKTPIRPRDVDTLLATSPPGLGPTLADLFDYLYPYRDMFDGIWQGDLLFSPDTLEYKDNIISFQPNIIKYKLLMEEMEEMVFGVIWHTFYQKEGGIWWNQSIPPKIPGIYNNNNNINYNNFSYHNLSCTNESLIGLNDIALHKIVIQYINACIKMNQHIDLDDFLDFLTHKKKNAITFHQKHLKELFNVRQEVQLAKQHILDQLVIPEIETYLTKQDGTEIPCKHEGFVLRDGNLRRMAKLVDRQGFSRDNFNVSGDLKRGWQCGETS